MSIACPEPASLPTNAEAVPTAKEAYQFHASANFLFGILSDAGSKFGNDYTVFVVYCAFLVSAAADTLRNVVYRRQCDGYAPGILSANSVAEMTGIPRETVRRKCLQLVDRGLLERHSAAQYRCNVSSAEVSALVKQFQQIQPIG